MFGLSESVYSSRQVGHRNFGDRGFEAVIVRRNPRREIAAVRTAFDVEFVLVTDAARQDGIDAGQVVGGRPFAPVADDRFIRPIAVSVAAARVGPKERIAVRCEVLRESIDGRIVGALRAAVRLDDERCGRRIDAERYGELSVKRASIGCVPLNVARRCHRQVVQRCNVRDLPRRLAGIQNVQFGRRRGRGPRIRDAAAGRGRKGFDGAVA